MKAQMPNLFEHTQLHAIVFNNAVFMSNDII